MKRILSIVLTFSLLLSMFVVAGATDASGDTSGDASTTVEYMNENVVVKTGTDVASSTANVEGIKTLDYATTHLGNMTPSSNGWTLTNVKSNAWVAFDLGEAKDISRISIYQSGTNAKEYSVYATNSDAIWEEICAADTANQALSKKGECVYDVLANDNTEGTTAGKDVVLTVDGTIDRLIAEGAAIVQNVKSDDTDRKTVSSYITTYTQEGIDAGLDEETAAAEAKAKALEEVKLPVSFNKQARNARYVIVVIEDYLIPWYGQELDYVSIGYNADDLKIEEGFNINCENGEVVVSGTFDGSEAVGETYNVVVETYDEEGNLIKTDRSEASTVTSGENQFYMTTDIIANVQPTKAYITTSGNKTVVDPVEKTLYSLKVLAIGNSFSVDSMQWLYGIAKDLGVDNIVLGNVYKGGCSLKEHATNAANDTAAYVYYKNTSDSWTNTSSQKMSTCIKDEDWNLFVLHQVVWYGGMEGTYEPYLTNLIDYVEANKTNQYAKIAYFSPWAFSKDSAHGGYPTYYNDQQRMYNEIIAATKSEIETNDAIDFIIPTAEAIQNARTSFLGDTLNRDGFHLNYGYGRYIAGLTWFHKITGLPIDSLSYVPDDENFQGTDDAEAKLFNAQYLDVAIKSAKAAVANPNVTTKIGQTPDVPDEYGENVVDAMSLDVGIKMMFGRHPQAIRTLEGPTSGISTYYSTIGNFGSNANVWVAFDLQKAKDVVGIDLYQPKKGIVNYSVYATNNAEIYEGLTKNTSISSDVLTSLADDKAAEGALTPYGSGNDLVPSVAESHDMIKFAEEVNARYIILVVTSVKATYYGTVLDYVGIYCDNTNADTDIDNNVHDIMCEYVDIWTRQYKNYTNNNTLKTLDGPSATPGYLGQCGTQIPWGAFDLGESKDVVSIDLYQTQRLIKDYKIYATNDDTVWSEITALNGANISDATLNALDVAGACVNKGTLSGSSESTGTVATSADGYDKLIFADGSVNARYIIIVVTSAYKNYAGLAIDYVGINCAKTGIENITVSEWAEGGKVTYTANVVNTGTQNARPVVVYEAQKDSTGKLLVLTSVERTLDANEGRTFSDEITLVNGATRVEFFIVDKNAFAPLTKKYYNYSE